VQIVGLITYISWSIARYNNENNRLQGTSHWPSTQKRLVPKAARAWVIFSSCFALPSISLTFSNGQNNSFCSGISGYPPWFGFYVNMSMLSGDHHHHNHRPHYHFPHNRDLSSFYRQQNANHTTWMLAPIHK